MFPIAFFPDFPDCSIEQVSSTQETIIISLSSTREGATCPDCGEYSSHIHSTSTRSRHVPAFGWATRSPSAPGAKVSGLPLLRTITAVAPVPLSPEQARQHYHLDGASALLVTQPSVVIVVALDTQTPASRYAGSIVHAQVQIRRQSLLSFVPLVGSMIGA